MPILKFPTRAYYMYSLTRIMHVSSIPEILDLLFANAATPLALSDPANIHDKLRTAHQSIRK